jgi:hydroxymethylbilane synthase
MSAALTIGSRGSKLALWQAEWVRARLCAAHPGLEVRVEIIKTSGDVRRDVPLSAIAGQGAFTKEIEQALLAGRVDIAVHSLKDLPTILPEALALAAVTEREDVRDALVLRADIAARLPPGAAPSVGNLPDGARVGTSSTRRGAQLKNRRPDLVVADIRGNVDTRLRQLDAGEYDALVLAAAGLRRLGLALRISAAIPVDEMLPAVGQGALGVETRSNDAETNLLVSKLNHPATRAACLAERALLRSLGGGCQLPIAAHATLDGHLLRLEALAAEPSGARIVRDSLTGEISEAETLGERLAESLKSMGALSLLANPIH